jgi:hypothetical protein
MRSATRAHASGRQAPARTSGAALLFAHNAAVPLQQQSQQTRGACTRRAVSNVDGEPLDPGQQKASTSGRAHAAAAAARARISTRAPARQLALTPPISELDVDRELWEVLDLCSDEELEALYGVLHSPSPFSPVVKSLVQQSEPALVALRGRTSLMHKVL